MVQVEGENLNSLFDILQEWEAILKTCDFPNTVTQDNSPRCGDEHLLRKARRTSPDCAKRADPYGNF